MNIGILGGNEVCQTEKLLSHLYENANRQVTLYNLKTEGCLGSLKILIINEKSRCLPHYLSTLEDSGVIVANGDDFSIRPYLIGRPAHLITYGFNQKASLTTSSVAQNDMEIKDQQKIQFCIQRSFSTLSGKTLEQQEFSLEIGNGIKNIYSVLGAIAAALLDDVYTNIPNGENIYR